MSLLSLDKFIAKYSGKYIDWDRVYGPQCIDLIRYYQVEVLGAPVLSIPASPTARQMFINFSNYETRWFEKVISPYGDPQVPVKGDIVFWGWYLGITGPSGHVAICTGAGEYQFISFDQNYGKPNFCRYVNHNYRGVMGWLHPKKA